MHDDVIVIGAGLAGMMAADTARAEGARVLLLNRGGIGLGTNSAMSNGVFTGPSDTYELDAYIKDTIEIGKGLNDPSVVRLVGREAPAAIRSLQTFGIGVKEKAGRYIIQPDRNDIIRGVDLVTKISDHLKKSDRVTLKTGFTVTEIVSKNGSTEGIRGFDASGKPVFIAASAVIIAGGGAGALYLRNDNQKATMGQGYALCAKAGLELWDMEFVQFYPMVFSEDRLPQVMLYPGFPKQVRMINDSGEDIAQKHGLESLFDAIRINRDSFSKLVYDECRIGPVYMDLRAAPDESWPEYPMTLLGKIKFDFKNRPIRITPGAHYCMGGVRVDEKARTGIKGLFACGEVVWGLNGANRRGGNALSECLVFGRLAGKSAAEHAAASPSTDPGTGHGAPAASSDRPADFRKLKKEIRETAWDYAGISRSESGMHEGLRRLKGLAAQIESAAADSMPEKKKRFDLSCAAVVLKAILVAGLDRKESRGAFFREDFPETDNASWRKNSCQAYDPESGDFKLDYHPVPGSDV
jgi:succinate dehydrogenase/fumarate reductase flavoprotein subunit